MSDRNPSLTHFEVKAQNRVVRVPDRGRYDKETIYRIVDAALICHVGLVEDEQPLVIPTLHARQGDQILLHGATKSRLIQHVQAGRPVCLTMTLVDGLVLARSVFHHSINYRSAVLFGRGYLVPAEEKLAALEYFTEKLLPGRWQDARPPNSQELKATAVVSIPIDLASAKIRSAPPSDDEADLTLPVWAGVIPLHQQALPPENDPTLGAGIPVPDYVWDYVEKS